jgi:hypothetical protein
MFWIRTCGESARFGAIVVQLLKVESQASCVLETASIKFSDFGETHIRVTG